MNDKVEELHSPLRIVGESQVHIRKDDEMDNNLYNYETDSEEDFNLESF